MSETKESALYEIRLRDRFSSPLSSLESKMNHFEGKVGGLQSAFTGLGGTIAGAFTGGLVAGGIESFLSKLKDIAIEAVNVTREFTNMREAIEFASGSRAGENIEFLDNLINRLGLDVTATYKGFKTFQGALMGTTLEGEKGLKIFEAVSKASTVMKLSGEQTEGAFLALGQMISKGTVAAEELRGQLGERLPGAFQIFARSLGVSTKKLGDMLKQGDVLAEDALPKFAAELERVFGPGVSKAQLSFNANMNRFSNFVLQAKLALGNGLIPVINEFASIIPQLDFSPLLYTFQQLKDEIAQVLSVWKELFSAFGVSLTTFEAVTIALRYLAYAFRVAFFPIRIGIQLYTQFVNLLKNSIDILKGVGEVLSGLWTYDFVKVEQGINRMGDGFKKLAKDASEAASTFMHDEKEGWKKIFAPINDPTKEGNDAFAKNGASGKGGLSAADAGKTAGVEKIQSGTRNITVNITKLVEKITFESWNGRSEAQLKDMITKALVTAVNDVNIVAN
jgi:tape measure domain-containing protein